MENLVVSLETAKALKAAGFPQDTCYWAWWQPGSSRFVLVPSIELRRHDVHYAAPTAQEIMNELISNPSSFGLTFKPFSEQDKSWLLEAEGPRSTYYVEDDNNIAELLAGALLKLVETKQEKK